MSTDWWPYVVGLRGSAESSARGPDNAVGVTSILDTETLAAPVAWYANEKWC